MIDKVYAYILAKNILELLLPNGFLTELLLTDSERKEGGKHGEKKERKGKLIEDDRGF